MDTDRTSDRALPRHRRRRAAALLSGLLLAGAALLQGTPLRATAAGSDDAVSYRIDPAHSGAQPGDILTTPLLNRWSVDLGGNVSYPLIAGGRIFVTAADSGQSGSRLYALDPATGATLWGPIELGGFERFAASAYDNGRVFVVNYDGLLRAFDAPTGTQVWSVQLPGQYAFSSPPTALSGIVYISGSGSGGTVYAVSESSGAVLWMQAVWNGDDSAPAVSSTGVYVTYACQQDYAFDPVQGTPLWHHSNGCEGGGGATPALSAGRLYDLNPGYNTGPVVLDATTGANVGSFTADQPPAFDAGLGFFLSGGTLQAISLSTGAVDWSFSEDPTLNTAPVVAGGQVYIAGRSGMLYAVSESNGVPTWAQSIGDPTLMGSGCSTCPPAGLAVGEGLLAAPMGTKLTVFTSIIAPVVTGVSPNVGPISGGVTVSVSGRGFSQGVTAVRFNGVAATSVNVVSDTRLVAVSPAEAAGTADVTVADAAGRSVVSAADQYTVVASPG